MKREDINKERIIHRWNPAIILTGLGALACLVLSALVLILPLMTVNYDEGGVINSYSVNGLDIINGAISSFGASLLSSGNNLHDFLKVFDQDFSSCSNQILIFFKDYFGYAILGLALFTVLPILASIPQIFVSISYLALGKGKKYKNARKSAKSQTFLLGLMAFIYSIFHLLFQDVVKLMMPGSSVEPLKNTWMLLLIGFGIFVFLEFIYSFFLKGRILGSRSKVYNGYKSNHKVSSKPKEEIKEEETIHEESTSLDESSKEREIPEANEEANEEPEIYEKITISDEDNEVVEENNAIAKADDMPSYEESSNHSSEA